MKMKTKNIQAVLIVVVLISVFVRSAPAAQDKYTVRTLNRVALPEFNGYEAWQDVALSATEEGIKAILANPIMIKAYQAGIPGNRKPLPDGVMTVKIE
jgi:hypothetical protein